MVALKRLFAVMGVGVMLPAAAAQETWESAAALESSKQYAEAQEAYADLWADAARERDCDGLVRGIWALRNTTYYSRRPEGLEALEPQLEAVVGDELPCRARCLAQFAYGLRISGRADAADALIERLAAGSPAPDLAALYDLWHERRRYEVVLVSSGADDPKHPDWKGQGYLLGLPHQVVAGSESWGGEADASARIQFGRLRDALYIRIQTTDDHAAAGDSLVVAIDADISSGSILRREAASGPSLQFFTVPLNRSDQQVVPGFTRAWYKCFVGEGGSLIEIGLPKDSVPAFVAEADRRYGMDVFLYDEDAGGETVLRLGGLTADRQDMYLSPVLSFSDD